MIRIVVTFLAYSILVLLVPCYPNLYTLLINLVAAVVSVVLSATVRKYFRSRPVHAKNIISMNIELLTYVCDLATIRLAVLSIMFNLFHQYAQLFLDEYPHVFIPLLEPVLRQAVTELQNIQPS